MMLDIVEQIIAHGICWGNVCSGGLVGIFGNPVFLGIFGLLFIIGLCFALRFSIDLMIMGVIVMVLILSYTVLPEWIFWLVIIGAAILLGFMFKRLLGR